LSPSQFVHIANACSLVDESILAVSQQARIDAAWRAAGSGGQAMFAMRPIGRFF
jgi:hypothetical protein